jgi:hypothetical protein
LPVCHVLGGRGGKTARQITWHPLAFLENLVNFRRKDQNRLAGKLALCMGNINMATGWPCWPFTSNALLTALQGFAFAYPVTYVCMVFCPA